MTKQYLAINSLQNLLCKKKVQCPQQILILSYTKRHSNRTNFRILMKKIAKIHISVSFQDAFSFFSLASSCLTTPALLILANISLKRSKSLRDALLFWTISFLPHELFSHLFLTSASHIKTIRKKT